MRLLFLLSLSSSLSFSAAAQEYQVVNLDPLGAYSQTEASSVNEDGSAAGWGEVFGPPRQPLLWSADTPAELPLLGADTLGEARVVLDSGLVYGSGTELVCLNPPGCSIEIVQSRPMVWVNGSPLALTDLVTGGDALELYEATDADEAGRVVGRAYFQDQFGFPWRAFLFDSGVVTDLGSLGGGPNDQTDANAIGSSGHVVGASWVAGKARAYVWEGGTMTDLHAAAGILGQTSQAQDVNAGGIVVGAAHFENNFNVQERAARWKNGVVTDLGTLGGTTSMAAAINDAGTAVGWSFLGNDLRATLWEGSSIVDLNDHIDPELGWTLLKALDINESGQIVGQGLHQGVLKAFRLDPVECAGTLASYGVGCAGSGGFVPALSGAGCASPGETFELVFENGLGGAAALLGLGTGQATLPLGAGCELAILPLTGTLVPLVLSGTGPGGGSLTVPLSFNTGPFQLYLQAAVVDPGAALGFALTNALSVSFQ